MRGFLGFAWLLGFVSACSTDDPSASTSEAPSEADATDPVTPTDATPPALPMTGTPPAVNSSSTETPSNQGSPVQPSPVQPAPTTESSANPSVPATGVPPAELPTPSSLGTVSISAGSVMRSQSIVQFALPGELVASLSEGASLQDGQGSALPVQVERDGTATFILPALGTEQQATYQLLAASTPNTIIADERPDGVHFSDGAQTIFRFITGGQVPEGIDEVFNRGGYIHPLMTPSGVRVTGDYDPGHAHHHGIWSAWREVSFDGRATDFWNMHDEKGLADFRALESTWSGTVHAGLEAQLMQVDLTSGAPIDALEEHWQLKAYRTYSGDTPYFVLDIISTQTPATNTALQIREYLYGGFGIRGREDWTADNSDFLTSEGDTRETGEDTQARWTYFGGDVAGAQAGMVLLGHPDNFRAPQKVRLHPEMPYYSYAPVKDGDFTIEPGDQYTTRFRVLTFDGQPDATLIERLWADYADPATAAFQP